jgi:hypothetical protein
MRSWPLPSVVARRKMWLCMIEEPIGLKYRHDLDVDHILRESDYPHADTPFPNTRATFKAPFDGVPNNEVEKTTHLNAEALFCFPLTVPEGYGQGDEHWEATLAISLTSAFRRTRAAAPVMIGQ